MPRAAALPFLFVLAGLAATPSPKAADEPKAGTTTAPAPETEEEKKERETRRQCALALCATLHNHKPDAGDVTCSVRKTWRKEVLSKIMQRGKVTWPWGYARCATDLKFDRAVLVKGMTSPEFE